MQVERYQIRYENEKKYINPADTPDGKIVIIIKSENTKIEARIKYEGFHNWTKWISSDMPVSLVQI